MTTLKHRRENPHKLGTPMKRNRKDDTNFKKEKGRCGEPFSRRENVQEKPASVKPMNDKRNPEGLDASAKRTSERVGARKVIEEGQPGGHSRTMNFLEKIKDVRSLSEEFINGGQPTASIGQKKGRLRFKKKLWEEEGFRVGREFSGGRYSSRRRYHKGKRRRAPFMYDGGVKLRKRMKVQQQGRADRTPKGKAVVANRGF